MYTIKHHTFLRVYLMSVLNNFFHPLKLASGITLRNRIVMSPMTTWSGTDDFQISDEEEAYYRLRVKGVGLVVSGCAQVTPNGIGFTHMSFLLLMIVIFQALNGSRMLQKVVAHQPFFSYFMRAIRLCLN
ncbi:hypothetical protein [Acinetobacter calcoaceticus]|uniref:oxidoreductase n=1 Tax=Acinetobacter calcoaceticus TaxID=471 RepID=UPI002F915BF6